MNDWAVFWLMVLIVVVLVKVAVHVHATTERRVSQEWNAKFGPGRAGPPRVVP